MLENRSGEVTRRFVVDIQGTWQGNNGVLQEYFTFDDGEQSERIWTINFIDENNFTATAADQLVALKVRNTAMLCKWNMY